MDISHGIISRDHVSVINSVDINDANNDVGSGGGNSSNTTLLIGTNNGGKTDNLIISPKTEVL